MAENGEPTTGRVMMGLAAVLIIAVGAAVVPKNGTPTPPSDREALAGGMGRIEGQAMACSSKETFLKLISFLTGGDRVAFRKAYADLSDRGECRILPGGQEVYVSERSWYSGVAAVRPAGEVETYWVSIGRIKAK